MKSITTNQLQWLDRLRANASERFREQGLPTTKLEAWRFTNIDPIRRVNFQPAQRVSPLPASLKRWIDSVPLPRLVFVDGFLYQSRWCVSDPLPPLAALPLCKGEIAFLKMPRLASPLQRGTAAERQGVAHKPGCVDEGGLDVNLDGGEPSCGGLIESHLGRYADVSANAFVAWNTAEFGEGAFIVIPPNTTISDPIHLVFLSTAGDAPQVSFPRNLIILGEGAAASFVEVFLSADANGVHLTNAVTEIAAGLGSTVNYYKIVHEAPNSFHVATTAVSVGRDANLTAHSFTLGSALVRNELRVFLDGEGAQCTLNGLFLADGDCVVDNQTEIDHRKPHTTSRELYKGILAGRGQGVFNGAIVVGKDAQKTNAVQHNKNLVLSEDARINTKPQLEIRADDVRCAHGASIGQIDQESLFYLRTRGLDERTARRILIRGFASEILDGVRVPTVLQHCEGLLDEWFERRLEAA